MDYDERVLPSIGNEVLKAIVVRVTHIPSPHLIPPVQAQFDASELITQREIVSSKCREALNSRAKTFRIVLDDISITHLAFGKVCRCNYIPRPSYACRNSRKPSS